jgi:hypothetical protein
MQYVVSSFSLFVLDQIIRRKFTQKWYQVELNEFRNSLNFSLGKAKYMTLPNVAAVANPR